LAIKCPACHAENPDDLKFCGECGTRLTHAGLHPASLTKTLETPVQILKKKTLIAGKYRILEELGRGGMGIVYKAEDIKLQRPVALKFLPHQWVSDPDARERFTQEARAASALDHSNICNIYEIGETDDGRMYIAMAFYEGESLREKIRRAPLSPGEAVDIALQVTEGLAKAHGKGIVHRDIKPANILITTDAVAKVVDFGLAKLSGQIKLTREGTTVGTVAYMSPEQAKGEAVDQRTDIWSLGVVLYEMLSGVLPFKGDHEQTLIHCILHDHPEPLTRLRPNIPLSLERLVQKALEKDRSLRYQKMAEVLEALEAARVPGLNAPQPEKSILVLPFKNISADPEQDYFCDGMTEELISDLSKIGSLRVISRTSSMIFKGTKKDIPAIAREVHVRYVLEGSVRKAGNNLRITAQLIEASNDAHIWAEKYGGTLDDVFDIQEKVSQSIVDALKLKLTQAETERLAERPIPSALAYEFYLKARQEILKWTEEGLGKALRYLQSGLEIVGENALLYGGMAYVHFQYFNLGLKGGGDSRKQAEDDVRKAFALDSNCSLANFVQGNLIAWRNHKEGIAYFKRVLDKNPNDFDTLFFLSCLLGTLGRTRAVIPLEERTIKIDPLNALAHVHSAFNRMWDGEYALALERLGRLHRSFPEDLMTKWSYGLSLAYMDRNEEAGRIFDEVAREQPGSLFACLGQSFKCALEGKRAETLAMLDSNPNLRNPWDFQTTYWKTECLALIGEREMALDCLEHDIDLGMSNYPLMSELDPFLANIRGEARFKRLLERVKYEWEHFEE
jgi:serine/threonine protein kinase/tetratricopeptide (TPR) repeat protein